MKTNENWEDKFDSIFTEIDEEFGNRYMKGGGSPMQIKDFIRELLKKENEN